jgi:predicted dehydrogenase
MDVKRPPRSFARVRWGVIGVAKIATIKVIPAMQRSEVTEIVAIGSRDLGRARRAATALGIPRAYGSYEDVIADPAVDAVYIPLPNHLHVEWSTRAAEAGKHVLCEKPIGLNEADARRLVAVRDRTGVRIQEAFMVRTHPQWTTTLDLARSGALGDLRAMVGVFSYFNDDAGNIRNVAGFGGGALLDIGCYFVMTSRLIFGREPVRVLAWMERDPAFGVDRLTSMVLDFGDATFSGTCATQMAPSQRIHITGTRGRVEIEIPFNAVPDVPAWFVCEGIDGRPDAGPERRATVACDQYTIQGDRFAEAIRTGGAQPYALEESVANMRVIDNLFRSAAGGEWVALQAEAR